MIRALLIGWVGLTVLGLQDASKRGLTDLVVLTKVAAVPAEAFAGGQPMQLKATFAAKEVVPTGPICAQSGFAIRIYNASLVAVNPPRFTADSTDPVARPRTPFLHQAAVALEPRSEPNAATVEKTFGPLVLDAKKTRSIPRLYIGLFQLCGVEINPEKINDTGDGIIFSGTLNGRPLGGTFFKRDCTSADKRCRYVPES